MIKLLLYIISLIALGTAITIPTWLLWIITLMFIAW